MLSERSLGAGSAALNHDTLQRLRLLQQPGAADLVASLLDLFLDVAPTRMQALRRAVERDDAAELFQSAHALAGEAATLGAEEVRSYGRWLADIGRAGSTDGAAALLEGLQGAFERVEHAVGVMRSAG